MEKQSLEEAAVDISAAREGSKVVMSTSMPLWQRLEMAPEVGLSKTERCRFQSRSFSLSLSQVSNQIEYLILRFKKLI